MIEQIEMINEDKLLQYLYDDYEIQYVQNIANGQPIGFGLVFYSLL